ncbi:MAG TPA: cupin domain-containing protein, partial [Chloroflexota bacterium]|nr:cupin domain-containing protein [Chloroflexota bacterium]
MNLQTFDWRDDPMGTVIAVPEVRARFMRFEPGRPPGGWHSHEESGGVEVFLVLRGAMKFEIDDETVIATAGQAVVAYPHQKHRASCAGDEPAILYLTVTPHRRPTHTFYDAEGNRLPDRLGDVTYTWQGRPALGPLPPRAAE